MIKTSLINNNKNNFKDASLIIAAAGKGSRLQTKTPKVLYSLAGKTILERIINFSKNVCSEIIIVSSPSNKCKIENFIKKKKFKVKISTQLRPTGMADAVQSGYNCCTKKFIYVIWGDQPCYSDTTLKMMLKTLKEKLKFGMILPLIDKKNPYTHFVKNKKTQLLVDVLEKREGYKLPQKGLSDCGIFLFKKKTLEKLLHYTKDNKEFIGKKTNERSFIKLFPYLEKKKYYFIF